MALTLFSEQEAQMGYAQAQQPTLRGLGFGGLASLTRESFANQVSANKEVPNKELLLLLEDLS